jgi:hypothetical protein
LGGRGWQIIPVGNHWYRIENDSTGPSLEVPDASMELRAKIEQAKTSDGFHRRWRPIAVR